MTKPGENDINLHGDKAIEKFTENATGEDSSDWAAASLNEVKDNMNKTGFREDNVVYIQGKVEDTIPKVLPKGPISILRLDTDW